MPTFEEVVEEPEPAPVVVPEEPKIEEKKSEPVEYDYEPWKEVDLDKVGQFTFLLIL
jgi:hypothetical protein